MNYCRHDLLLYLGKKKIINKYIICYEYKYICAYCGTMNVDRGSKIKEILDLSNLNVDLNNNKNIYKIYNKINIEEEKSKNNIKKLVLKR